MKILFNHGGDFNMKKIMIITITALLFVFIFSNQIFAGQGWQSGISISNQGVGWEIIEYETSSGFSFYTDFQVKNSWQQRFVRAGSKYYINEYYGITPFGNLALNYYSSEQNNVTDENNVGIYIGSGIKMNLTDTLNLSLEIGHSTASTNQNYFGGSLKVNNIFERLRAAHEKKPEEKIFAKSFIEDHPDLNENAENYILENYDQDTLIERLEYINDNPELLSTEEKNHFILTRFWKGMSIETFEKFWGEPEEVSTVSTVKNREKRAYKIDVEGPKIHFYFEDGKLTTN